MSENASDILNQAKEKLYQNIAKERVLEDREISLKAEYHELESKRASLNKKEAELCCYSSECDSIKKSLDLREVECKQSCDEIDSRMVELSEREAQALKTIEYATEREKASVIAQGEREKLDSMIKEYTEKLAGQEAFSREIQDRASRIKIREVVVAKKEKTVSEREVLVKLAEAAIK
jgi:hypothetical protein